MRFRICTVHDEAWDRMTQAGKKTRALCIPYVNVYEHSIYNSVTTQCIRIYSSATLSKLMMWAWIKMNYACAIYNQSKALAAFSKKAA